MPDLCQPILNEIAGLNAEKKFYQDQLKQEPGQKAVWIKLIQEVNKQLREQGERLAECRKENPLPLRPNIGFQFSTCLPDDSRPTVEARLTQAFAEQNGVAHAACIDGTERVGIWAPSVGEEKGRRLGLEFVNLLREPQESFGQSIGHSFIKRNADAGWEAQPKAYNDDGVPTPEGPVFLTNFSFRMESPNRVITTIEGFRRFPFPLPDLDFTVTITDILVIRDGQIHCDTSTHVDVESNLLDFLVDLFLGGPLGVVRVLFRIGADIWDSSLAPEDDRGGVGKSLLALFPQRIDLGNGFALATSYSRIEVFSGFILAGGSLVLASFAPELLVSADLSIKR